MRFAPLSDSRFEYLCEVFAADKYETQEELILDWKALGKKFPDSHLLLTLDDLSQAQYTSMHSKGFHDIDHPDLKISAIGNFGSIQEI